MAYEHVLLLSPPFYSHFMPMLAIAKSLKKMDLKVTIGCSREFEKEVIAAGLDFVEIDLNTNRNTGTAKQTYQPESEKARLEEFFEATGKGPVETLITQMKHREMDMLPNPHRLMEQILTIENEIRPDLWMVDVLSYGATLSLHCLGLRYMTFCPPHPDTIPFHGEHHGIPKNWPSWYAADPEKTKDIEDASRKTQDAFTSIFNTFISIHCKNARIVDNAFRLASDQAVIYNYLDFDFEENISEKPLRIFIGHAFEEESLNGYWLEKVAMPDRTKILITLGTFLSERMDVLEQLISACKEFDSEALLVVSAGSNADKLKNYESANTIVSDFIPQKGIMRYMDLVIHHGGCNTFTESVHYGKPMIILPFSSDQFAIAFDAERNNLAVSLDPNRLSKSIILDALNRVFRMDKESLLRWSRFSKARGPAYAAAIIKTMISNRTQG